MAAFKTYYWLTKPGIVYGNCISAAAGFLLASKRHVNIWLLLATIAGMALIIACACVVNNYIDKNIDAKMDRTKKRAMVQGTVSGTAATIYAAILGIVGFTILILYTNWLTVAVGFMGLFAYLVLYGWGKRNTVWGTLIGSISGSMPLVAGYTAVTNHFDGGAWLLFALMAAWQMPHFYAIGIYRLKDYTAAGLPIWPVKRGIRDTKRQIILFIILFMIVSVALSVGGYTGNVYAFVTLLLGFIWLYKGIQGYQSQDETRWARDIFGFSLVVLLGFSLMMAVNAWLP